MCNTRNWPCNELIGKGLIIPPAAVIETAIKDQKNICFDWWFATVITINGRLWLGN
jgi:hypothetical protein